MANSNLARERGDRLSGEELKDVYDRIIKSPFGSAIDSVVYSWDNPNGPEAGYQKTVERIMLRDRVWSGYYAEAAFAIQKHRRGVANEWKYGVTTTHDSHSGETERAMELFDLQLRGEIPTIING